MKFKTFLFLCLVPCIFFISAAHGEENELENRIDSLENKVQIIDSNQINYRIEKDLLKETYSNNYERINLFITIVFGIVAIFGYLGLRDISKIKEKYESELNEIKKVKNQFDQKSFEFDIERKKIDEELKTIIKENQEQSQKIKFIELKEKGLSLFANGNLSMSLEFLNTALNINESDVTCLQTKARILLRINQLENALQVYKKSANDNPDDLSSKMNFVECLYFSGQIDEARKIIEQNKILFESKCDGKLIEFLDIFSKYYDSDLDALHTLAKGYVNNDNLEVASTRIEGWDFQDAIYFVHFLENSDLKIALLNIIFYWAGKINGKTLLNNLKIPMPKPTAEVNCD